jgi:uncharacterized protein YbjT (DUF2867 family)
MKVLILGATGLVGRNALAHALTQAALTKQDKLINPVAPKVGAAAT